MTENPLVSVLMTAYNREQYIAESVEAVLSSDYDNFELIIVDDGSKDNTLNIARSFEAKNEKVKVFLNEKNLGDFPNRNRAAMLANGKYLMYADSDDKLFPFAIRYCVESMENNPGVKMGIYYPYGAKGKNVLLPKESIHRHFFDQAFLTVGPGGTILNREFFMENGMYPTRYGPANDMYFDLWAATKTSLVLLEKEFMFYRIHEGQGIHNKYAYIINNYKILRDALLQIDLPLSVSEKRFVANKNKRRFLVNLSKYFFSTLNFSKVKQALNQTQFSLPDAVAGIFHLNRIS